MNPGTVFSIGIIFLCLRMRMTIGIGEYKVKDSTIKTCRRRSMLNGAQVGNEFSIGMPCGDRTSGDLSTTFTASQNTCRSGRFAAPMSSWHAERTRAFIQRRQAGGEDDAAELPLVFVE